MNRDNRNGSREPDQRGFAASFNRHGFTLLEVVLASAIMVTVLTASLSLTATFLRAWNETLEHLRIDREATYALELIASDLQGLIRDPERSPLVITIDTDQAAIAQLRLFSASINRETPSVGDIYAIAVFEQPQIGGGTRGVSLHRIALDPETTHEAWINNPESLYRDIEAFIEEDSWNYYQTVILEGVLGLEYDLIFREGTDLIHRRFPNDQSVVFPDPDAPELRLPAAIDITLRVITPSYRSSDLPAHSNEFDGALQPPARTFSRRVVLQ